MKFLSLDSPLMRALSRMTDILWLNILTIVCSIPIITAGAAFTSLHYVCLKMVRDEESYITKEYFKSFKKNFVQSTVIWLIMVAVFVLIYIDFRCLTVVTNPTIMFAALVAASVFVIFTGLYVFPVLSHFENTIRGTIKNSFFMSILALPRTILMVILNVLPLAIMLASTYFQAMGWLIPLAALFWFSAPAYFCARLYNKTFKRFEPENPEENDDFSWSVGGEEENASETGNTIEMENGGEPDESGKMEE